jgi:rubrerythrin
VKQAQVKELLLQSLEHERGGIKVYEMPVQCAVNEDLEEEWAKYLEQTREHDRILTSVCEQLELDPEEDSPGRGIVNKLGASLVQAMEAALKGGNPVAAELVACECVVLAETKDHADRNVSMTLEHLVS